MLGDCAQLSIGVQFWTPIDTLTTRKEKLIKIGAKVKVVSHGRSDRPILSNEANPSTFASRNSSDEYWFCNSLPAWRGQLRSGSFTSDGASLIYTSDQGSHSFWRGQIHKLDLATGKSARDLARDMQCGRLPSRLFGLYICHGDRIRGALAFDRRVVERYRKAIDREVLGSCRQSQEASVHDIETLEANRR